MDNGGAHLECEQSRRTSCGSEREQVGGRLKRWPKVAGDGGETSESGESGGRRSRRDGSGREIEGRPGESGRHAATDKRALSARIGSQRAGRRPRLRRGNARGGVSRLHGMCSEGGECEHVRGERVRRRATQRTRRRTRGRRGTRRVMDETDQAECEVALFGTVE